MRKRPDTSITTQAPKVGGACLEIHSVPLTGASVLLTQSVTPNCPPYVSHTLPVEPPAFRAGQSYLLGMWVSSPGPLGGQLMLTASAKGSNGQTASTPFTSGPDWTWVAVELDLDQDFYTLTCSVQSSVGAGPGFLRLDGAMLV